MLATLAQLWIMDCDVNVESVGDGELTILLFQP